jgi:error-prone DNA polymerase
VIARQRPGTANGFVFLSLEDETGIANAILTPDIFKQYRQAIIDGRFLLLDGRLQNVDNVVSVKVSAARIIDVTAAMAVSHDFH